MQNGAILRNALRKRNDELPSVSNDMQNSETLRNSLGLNYKSGAPSGGCERKLGKNIVNEPKLTLYFSAGEDVPGFVIAAGRAPFNS
jgi:hypothetical protein